MNVYNSSRINLFDVRLTYNFTILHAASIDLTGNPLGSNAQILYSCLDGIGICDTLDGPSVVHVAFYILGNATVTPPQGGVLFKITFNIVHSGFSQLHLVPSGVYGTKLWCSLACSQLIVPLKTQDGYFNNKMCGPFLCTPPASEFTFSPSLPLPNDPVMFNASRSKATNANAVIRSYFWNWGDARSPTGPSPQSVTTHTFSSFGNFSVTLTVTDSYGISWMETLTVPVTVYVRSLFGSNVFATGLNNPRGLTFGPDGYLYVAEGGTGGSISSARTCTQVGPPVGPYTGGLTARISKISPTGVRSTVADNLPSDRASAALGSLISGVSDVKFIHRTLYGLEAAAGCSHGLAGTSNTLFRVNRDGTTTTVADLSAFLRAHPVANPGLGAFEPDGTWHSMVLVHGAFYVTEPSSQQIDLITLDGKVTRVVDLSTIFVPPQGWKGPTGITVLPDDHTGDIESETSAHNVGEKHDVNLYFGTRGTLQVVPTTESIYQLLTNGSTKLVASGFTAVVGVAFDSRDRLYVLESDTVAGFGTDAFGTGTVVRINHDGTQTTIVTGLTFPTAMTFGPDDKLYVSNFNASNFEYTFGSGVSFLPGAGQIVAINICGTECSPQNDNSSTGSESLSGGSDFFTSEAKHEN